MVIFGRVLCTFSDSGRTRSVFIRTVQWLRCLPHVLCRKSSVLFHSHIFVQQVQLAAPSRLDELTLYVPCSTHVCENQMENLVLKLQILKQLQRSSFFEMLMLPTLPLASFSSLLRLMLRVFHLQRRSPPNLQIAVTLQIPSLVAVQDSPSTIAFELSCLAVDAVVHLFTKTQPPRGTMIGCPSVVAFLTPVQHVRTASLDLWPMLPRVQLLNTRICSATLCTARSAIPCDSVFQKEMLNNVSFALNCLASSPIAPTDGSPSLLRHNFWSPNLSTSFINCVTPWFTIKHLLGITWAKRRTSWFQHVPESELPEFLHPP